MTEGGPANDAIQAVTDEARRLLGVRRAWTTIASVTGEETTAISTGRRRGDPDRQPALIVPVTASDGLVLGRMSVAHREDGEPLDATDRVILDAFAQLVADVVHDATTEGRLRAIVDHAPAAMFLKDRHLRYVAVNQSAAELHGAASPEAMIGRTDADFLDPEAAAEIMASDRKILAGAGDIDEEQLLQLPGGEAILHAQIFAIRDQFGRATAIGGVVSDVTDRRRAETALAERDRRYRMLFQQAQEGIVLADHEGRYVDANPTACAILGRPREDIVGKLVSELVVDGSMVWEAFRSASGEHGVVRGDVEFQRPDGGRVTVEFAASPFTTDGVNVAILRDVTDRRRRELGTRARLEVIAAIRALDDVSDVAAASGVLCRTLVDLGAFEAAAVFGFTGTAAVDLLAVQTQSADERESSVPPIPPSVARRVRRRIRDGAWTEDWTTRSLTFGVDLAALGVASTACLPLELRGQIVGMLVIGDRHPRPLLDERLGDLIEFAGLASAHLGPALAERKRIDDARRAVRRMIDRRAFRPVFQPIVDLESAEVVGYEGLTRFTDGTPPDLRFALAHSAGVGRDLEIATLEAVLEASGPLPANRYLDVNVSPGLVLAREPLRSLLRDAGFNVVVEITEHEAIEDYAAMRAAIEALGDRVRLAVDDAGAGFASLRHVVELRPDYVKLDRGLTAGIHRDPARQAMVAGLNEFANRLGVTLIAEGIELEEERQMLLELMVARGQGFLFGRPMGVEELTARR